MHACNNADISIPQFSHLKRLIFVHGRLSHIRNGYVANYSVYKNSVNVFVNLFFQAYNCVTVEVATEPLMIMMFNTLITFACVFFFAISEKDAAEKDMTRQAQLLKKGDYLKTPNLWSMGWALCQGLYQGILIFFINKAMFVFGGHSSFVQTDLYEF